MEVQFGVIEFGFGLGSCGKEMAYGWHMSYVLNWYIGCVGPESKSVSKNEKGKCLPFGVGKTYCNSTCQKKTYCNSFPSSYHLSRGLGAIIKAVTCIFNGGNLPYYSSLLSAQVLLS